MAIMQQLVAATADAYDQPNSSMTNFRQFRGWHEAAHALDRREDRLKLSLNVCSGLVWA